MDKKMDGLRPEDLIGDPENPNSPAQMLEALVAKAIDTGSMRPLGQAMGGFQAQMDAVFGMFQHNMQRLGHILSVNSMQLDTLRMALVGLVDFLIEKGVMTQEEWDKTYEEKVQKKMEERIALAKKQHEEATRVDEQAGVTEEEIEKEEAEECACCEKESDVVLASERADSVVKFPDKTE